MSEDKKESKYWVFTLHATDNIKGNYVEDWPSENTDYKTQMGVMTVTYTCGQEEMGDEGGYHLQGYVEFKNKVKFNTLKNNFSQRIHWAVRLGTAKQAEHYAQKDMDCKEFPVKGNEQRFPDTRWNKGTMSTVSKGSRTDLESVREMILSGKKRKAVALEHMGTYVKYHRGIEVWANAVGISLDETQKAWVERSCHILYGPSGTGKSLAADRLIGDESVYLPEQNAQRQLSFENYAGESWILLDDFEPGTLSAGVLKRMMDNRPCTLPGRGVAKKAQHKGVIITTNHNPMTWVEGAMQDVEWEAISRRCVEVFLCKEDNWTVIGGRKFYTDDKKPKSLADRTMPSPLPQLLEWARQRDASGLTTEDDE